MQTRTLFFKPGFTGLTASKPGYPGTRVYDYVSPGDAWFDGSAVLYYWLVLVELVRSEVGGRSLCAKFRMERVSPYGTNHFWRGH